MADRFAVLGSPIGHSKSPLLHRAAISALGVDAEYSAIDVNEADFSRFLTAQGDDFLGLSLTMPLKHVVRPLLVTECETSALAGAVNTIVRGTDGWHGFNTDVWGATTAIGQSLGTRFESATILGAGATASSLLVALSRLGVAHVTVLARNPGRAEPLRTLGESLGLAILIGELGESVQSELLVNTLPGTVELSSDIIEDLDAGALFDVAYDPWPTPLAREFSARGLPATSGLTMLLWQAVRQARVFYGDGVDEPLPNESLVVTAMRSAIGL